MMDVVVSVRAKPVNEIDKVWKVFGKNALQIEEETFQVDNVSWDESHEQFYSNRVSSCIQEATTSNNGGHSLTVIAHGLPGSGKTYTMMGTAGESRLNPEARGTIVRCFAQLHQDLPANNKATKVTCSFCHVFEDGRVADLLDTKKRNLQVETDESRGAYFIKGCTEQPLTAVNDVVRLIEKANLMRNAMGAIQNHIPAAPSVKPPAIISNIMNRYKPHRSHAVFQYKVERIGHRHEDSSSAIVSYITLIDLAGNTIQSKSDSTTPDDVGLRALQDTLDKLSNGESDDALTVCRSTSLTRLLHSCLFGNAKCLVISTLSEDSADAKQSLQLAIKFRYARNKSTVLKVPRTLTDVGKIAAEMDRVQHLVADKCTGIDECSSFNVNDDTSVTINGTEYADIAESTSNLLQRYLDLEGSLLQNNKGSVPTAKPLKSIDPLPFKPPPPSLHRLPTPSVLSLPDPPLAIGSPLLTPTIVKPVLLTSGTATTPQPGAPLLKPTTKLTPQRSPAPQNPPTLTRSVVPAVTPDAQPFSQSQKPTTLSPTKEHVLQTMRLPPISSPVKPQQNLIKQLSEHRQCDSLSSSDSEDDERRAVRRRSAKGRSSSPPPLQDIAHILPPPIVTGTTPTLSATPNIQSSIRQVLPKDLRIVSEKTGNINESTAKQQLLEQLSPSTPINNPPSLSSSPSSSDISVQKHQAITGGKKKKKTKKRQSHDNSTALIADKSAIHGNNSRTKLTPNKNWRDFISSSSSNLSEDDTFDPNFVPGQLTMRPQILSLPQLQYNPPTHQSVLVPPIGATRSHGNQAGLLPLPLQGVPQLPLYSPPAELLPPLYSETPNQAQSPAHEIRPHPHPYPSQSQPSLVSQEDMNAISDKDIHEAATYGVKQSYLKQLIMKCGVDYTDEYGRTPLMYSVLGNQPKMCEVLLQCNANIDVTDKSGNTALLWATIQAKTEIIKILLKYGANICKCDSNGRSVFHWAMKTPNVQCLKILCRNSSFGIENKKDEELLTPLHWAVMCEQPGHIRHLLKSLPSTDINPEDTKGRTPLNYAVLNFSPTCIQALLDCRPSNAVKHVDEMKRTALHYACAEGSADCVRTLLSSQHCDLHASDIRGTSPLHWAAASNQPGIVQLLLRRGADRGQTDNSSMTALDYAIQRNHSECVQILQTYGLRRPSSTWSIASQFSIRPPTPPELDRFGHVPLKRPGSSGRFSSPIFDRLPGDGHSADHAPSEGGATTEQRASDQNIVNQQDDQAHNDLSDHTHNELDDHAHDQDNEGEVSATDTNSNCGNWNSVVDYTASIGAGLSQLLNGNKTIDSNTYMS